MSKLYWKCPNCNSKVDFIEQMDYVFEDGEADFDPKSGLMMHTIECGGCPTKWILSISAAVKEDWGGIK